MPPMNSYKDAQPPPLTNEQTLLSSMIPADEGDEEQAEEDGEQEAVYMPKKKRRVRNKTTARRGPTALPKNRGTGFEEYFADPPMTPEEFLKEKNELYSEDIPFESRMQACIQRFRSRRRLQGDLTLFFNEYLSLGGVDTSPRAFGGLDPKELKGLTPAQRRELMAGDAIHDGSGADERFYDGDNEKWCVDFAGVAAGFLSDTLVELTNLEPNRMDPAIGVVDNFLRYVLHHGACPEYEDDVKRALQVCDMAREEWPMLVQLSSDMPGEFNLAAAELFCVAEGHDWSFLDFERRACFDPKTMFYSAMAMTHDAGGDFAQLCKGKTHCAKTYKCTLQITHIEPPDDRVVRRFKTTVLRAGGGGNEFRLKPLGKVILKPTVIEDEWVHPAMPSPLEGAEQVTLFFEDNILASLKPGMRMVSRIGELSDGFRFVKTIRGVVPTFYTFLPQRMMKHFKPPRENERPAPSIHDAEDDGRLDPNMTGKSPSSASSDLQEHGSNDS